MLTETGSLKVKEAEGGGFETSKILETGSQRDEEKKRRREERGRRQLTGRRLMYFGWRHPTYLYYLHIGATIGVIPIFYSNRGQIGVEHSCLHLDCSRFWVYSGVNPYFYNEAIFLVPGLYKGVF